MTQHLHEPTIDDLSVKLCFICREEERHDNPPDPPPLWVHPCKCTLVAHESCLVRWILTQQRDFGRSRGELKCPQCGELYEFEGYNPVGLRFLNSVNRALSRFGRVIILFCAGTLIVSFGAGIYLTCTTYGAFAVHEFLGPDMFRALLTANPTKWPWHAWIHLPLVPFSLIASRTSSVLWATSPLVPLLFPWPSTLPVVAAANAEQAGTWAVRPPAAVAPAPGTRVRDVPPRAISWPHVGLDQQGRQGPLQPGDEQEGLQRGQREQEQQERPPQLRPQQQQQRQQRQQAAPPGPGEQHRFQLQVGEQFHLEFTHVLFGPEGPPADAPGPALVAPVNPAAGAGAVDNLVGEEPQQPEGQQEQEEEQQAQPAGQGQEQWDENDAGAVAARAIRTTGASLGRLIGGALAMPTIARIMGAVLLRISHIVPLVRTIIAHRPPVPPAAPAASLVGLWGAASVSALRLFGRAGANADLDQSGLGAKLLGGFLATSNEWARSDPVWWRNALGLGIYLVAKDGLKVLHLLLAKKELKERHIKNKSFSGIDLTQLDLMEHPK
ncbi:hypothetical protein F5148DRAFT_1284464 [Russula earlei]|uniref:Uncharacterized protein n=1 Tax=Russula earlei TaxID=71964 RepID=A0ACC0U8M6_9AGAM|nr:hypothetical protein F5148DRAFT_1284464 [Russula earlei]